MCRGRQKCHSVLTFGHTMSKMPNARQATANQLIVVNTTAYPVALKECQHARPVENNAVF